MKDTEFARWLVEKAGVAAVSGRLFYHEGGETKLRFMFSKKDETLNEACRRPGDTQSSGRLNRKNYFF